MLPSDADRIWVGHSLFIDCLVSRVPPCMA